MTLQDRAKLRQLLDSFDETGLIALASKGIVRRATKDLQAGGISAEETDEAVVVSGPDWIVTMPPEGPSQATDDTKASGVTRQIITATMFLRDTWQAEASPIASEPEEAASVEPSPEADHPAPEAASTKNVEVMRETLQEISLESLEKWSGKGRLRDAVQRVEAAATIETEVSAACLAVRFVEHEVECRFFPPTGKPTEKKLLEGALCTAPKSQQPLWVAAGVLALQKLAGKTIEPPDAVVPADASGAPRDRGEVLSATRDLLEGMVATGLAHPSGRMVERLLTLSVSATGVHLPKLARQLRGLADDIELTLARDAKSDSARVADRVAMTHSLVRALAASGDRPPIELAGRHRTEYTAAGDLKLTGVGAWPWRTGSGFVGLTVLFWEENAKRFLTWSASRPEDGPQVFRPREVYLAESVWSGGGAPTTLSRNQFTLKDARVNPLGRLSGSQKSSVEQAELTQFETVDFGGRLFRSWQTLSEYALTTYPMGLVETAPLDHIVVLEPASWGERTFDELQQRFLWPIVDADGCSLALSLPWSGMTEDSIEFLEAAKPDRDLLRAVVARVSVSPGGLLVEPVSLLSDGTPQKSFVLNPAFDLDRITQQQSGLLERLRAKFGRNRISTTMLADGDFDDSEELETAVTLPTGLERRLSEIESYLLELSESGTRRFSELHRKRSLDLAAGVERLGLSELASVMRSVEEANPSAAVLQASYLCRLHRQAAVKELLAGSL